MRKATAKSSGNSPRAPRDDLGIGWSQFSNFLYEAMRYHLQEKVMGPTAHLYSLRPLQDKLTWIHSNHFCKVQPLIFTLENQQSTEHQHLCFLACGDHYHKIFFEKYNITFSTVIEICSSYHFTASAEIEHKATATWILGTSARLFNWLEILKVFEQISSEVLLHLKTGFDLLLLFTVRSKDL